MATTSKYGALAIAVLIGCTFMPSHTFCSDRKDIDQLIVAINEKPDPLHYEHTPAVEKLIEIGTPAIPSLLDLMLSEQEDTRLHAGCALNGIVLRMYGFVAGAGWTRGDRQKECADFYKRLGSLNWKDPVDKRANAVALWRKWLDEQQMVKKAVAP